MTEADDVEEERALRALFAGAVPSVADDGFSSSVVRRIRTGIWRRRLLLILASLIGFVIASPAIAELLVAMTQLLANFESVPDGASGAGPLRLLLSMLPVREAIADVSARLMDVSAMIAWFREHPMLLVVATPGVASLAMIRLLER